MFTLLTRFLCAAAFASAALAQGISVALPAAGASVTGGKNMTIQLERPTPTTQVYEIAIVVTVLGCAGMCTEDYNTLGSILYTGKFEPQSTNSVGNQFANFSVVAPDWFYGNGVVKIANFYLDGAYGTPIMEYANTTIFVTGTTG